jgi:hypothetical protein
VRQLALAGATFHAWVGTVWASAESAAHHSTAAEHTAPHFAAHAAADNALPLLGRKGLKPIPDRCSTPGARGLKLSRSQLRSCVPGIGQRGDHGHEA